MITATRLLDDQEYISFIEISFIVYLKAGMFKDRKLTCETESLHLVMGSRFFMF